MDVGISQTTRHSRWGVHTCEGVYSAPLAREAMRGRSSHPPKSRLFHLSRACVDPSESCISETLHVPSCDGIEDRMIPPDISHAMGHSLVTVREMWSEWHVLQSLPSRKNLVLDGEQLRASRSSFYVVSALFDTLQAFYLKASLKTM